MLASNKAARVNEGVRRALLLAGVAAVLALLLWFFLRDTGVVPVAHGSATDSDVSETSDTGTLANVADAAEPLRESIAPTEAESSLVEAPASPDTAGATELRGRVIDPKQQPLPGALVSLRRGEMRGFTVLDLELTSATELVAETLTDAAGEFRFELARGVPVDLHVEATNFCPALVPNRHAGEFVVVPMSAGFRVFGRVTRESDRAPVADARVRGFRVGGPSSFARTTHTASNGTYELLLAHDEKIALEVVPLVEQTPPWMYIELGADGQAEQDVVVKDGLLATGRVTSASDGSPIAGATVGEGWTYRRTAVTDANGEYRLVGCSESSSNELFAKARGFGQTKRQDLPAAVDGVLHVDFQLPPARRARGRVVDPDGAPLRDVLAAAVASESGAQGQRTDWIASRTDAAGRFEIESLTSDLRHALVLSKHGHGTRVYDFPPEEFANDDLDLGEFVLGEPALIAGVVEDEHGAGLAGVTVIVKGNNSDRGRMNSPSGAGGARSGRDVIGDRYTDSRSMQCSADGRFSFGDLSAGSYRVIARMEGWPDSNALHVTVADGEQKVDLRIVVANGARLSGRVLDPEGLPVANVYVSAGLVKLRGQPSVSNFSQPSVRSGGDGRFEFLGLDAGDYELDVWVTSVAGNQTDTPLLNSKKSVTTDADDIEIVLVRGATIRGTLRDADGNTLAGYSINDRGEGGRSAATDANGAFRLPVPAGRICELAVFGPDSDWSEPLSVVHSVVAGTHALEIALP